MGSVHTCSLLNRGTSYLKYISLKIKNNKKVKTLTFYSKILDNKKIMIFFYYIW